LIFGKTHHIIDFGTSKISVAAARKNGKDVEFLGMGFCEYAGFRDGEWVAPQDLEESIYLAVKDCEQNSGKKIRKIGVVIPGEFTRSFFSNVAVRIINMDGHITENDVRNLLKEGEASLPWPDDYQLIDTKPVMYFLDGQSRRQSPVGQYARDLEAFLSYTASDIIFMHDIENLLDGIGIGTEKFVPSVISTPWLIGKNSEKTTLAIIDSGYYSTDFIIYENGGVILHDNVPIGGYHLASDIMVKLGCDPDSAEKIKRSSIIGIDPIAADKIIVKGDEQKLSFDVEEVQYIIENRIYEISQIMLQNIEKTGMTVDSRLGIFITGGGISQIRGCREYMMRILGGNVKTFKPGRPVLATAMQTSICAGLEFMINIKDNINHMSFNRFNSKGLFN